MKLKSDIWGIKYKHVGSDKYGFIVIVEVYERLLIFLWAFLHGYIKIKFNIKN